MSDSWQPSCFRVSAKVCLREWKLLRESTVTCFRLKECGYFFSGLLIRYEAAPCKGEDLQELWTQGSNRQPSRLRVIRAERLQDFRLWDETKEASRDSEAKVVVSSSRTQIASHVFSLLCVTKEGARCAWLANALKLLRKVSMMGVRTSDPCGVKAVLSR